MGLRQRKTENVIWANVSAQTQSNRVINTESLHKPQREIKNFGQSSVPAVLRKEIGNDIELMSFKK